MAVPDDRLPRTLCAAPVGATPTCGEPAAEAAAGIPRWLVLSLLLHALALPLVDTGRHGGGARADGAITVSLLTPSAGSTLHSGDRADARREPRRRDTSRARRADVLPPAAAPAQAGPATDVPAAEPREHRPAPVAAPPEATAAAPMTAVNPDPPVATSRAAPRAAQVPSSRSPARPAATSESEQAATHAAEPAPPADRAAPQPPAGATAPRPATAAGGGTASAAATTTRAANPRPRPPPVADLRAGQASHRPATSTPPATAAPGSRAAANAMSAASAPASAGGEDGALLALLHDAIDRHKRYPGVSRRQQHQGSATVLFWLHPGGALQNIELAESSGHALLDRAALRAVAAVAPFGAAGRYLAEQRQFRVEVEFRLF